MSQPVGQSIAAYDQSTGQWSRLFVPSVLDAAGVDQGCRVLDVATGTGEAALAIAPVIGASFASRNASRWLSSVARREVEEPALAFNTTEGRVPLHGLAHARHGAHDERVEASPDIAFPVRHGLRCRPVRERRRRPSRSVGCRLRGGPALWRSAWLGLLCHLWRLLGRPRHCVHPSVPGRGSARHLAAYGNTNRERPVNSSRKGGGNGEENTQGGGGGSPNPMAMKLAMTVTVK